MNIGNLIKEFRRKNNLTQSAFGQIVGVNKQTISKWEKGILQPSTNKLYEIAQAIDVPVDNIINNVTEEGTAPFIFEHRSQYDVGLNSVYFAIHDFKSFCVFINLLESAHQLIEPDSDIIGFLLIDMSIDDPKPPESAIPISSISADNNETIILEIPDSTLELTEEIISKIEGVGLFNNESYVVNIYMKKRNKLEGFIQLILGFHNDDGDE